MKWLIWSSIDLENGLGGVEVHARSVAEALRKKDHEVVFSHDPEVLESSVKGRWDVIHTHGSQFYCDKNFLSWILKNKNVIWAHTLHGWSIERMLACHEYLWFGGYQAWFRERLAAKHANVVFGVHQNIGQRCGLDRDSRFVVCGNGWDAGNDRVEKSQLLSVTDKELTEAWLFIGRGIDKVKGAGRLRSLLQGIPLIAIPGDGFESDSYVKKTGVLTSSQIAYTLQKARGLIVPSYYEGLPLVVLEALAYGVPVITSKVGGLATLSKSFQGLYFCEKNLQNIRRVIKDMRNYDRAEAANSNRKHLQTWADVTDVVLHKVGNLK